MTSGAPAQRLTLSPSERVVRVRPHPKWRLPDLHEMLLFRELLVVLMWRAIKIRYKQTVLGATWVVLQPIIGTVVFTVFFNRVAKVPSQDVPYPLFALGGLVPWYFFSNGLTQASDSMVSGAALVSKVYFPRMLVPLGTVLAGGIDLAVTTALLLVVMGVYGIAPGVRILWLPVFVLLLGIFTAAAGVLSATVNVRYRDVRYIVPFVIQLWLFITPIVYPSTLLHGHWKTIAALNPMVGIIDGFRWCVLGTNPGPGQVLVPSVIITVAAVLVGLLYYARVERTLADVV